MSTHGHCASHVRPGVLPLVDFGFWRPDFRAEGLVQGYTFCTTGASPAQKINLDSGLWQVLRHPDREIVLYIPVQMDDGRLELFTGYRLQHSTARGTAKGGIHYSP